MGLHTGTPRVRGDNDWGQDVHYAAPDRRIGGAADGAQVLVSASTRALVPNAAATDLGEHALEDFPAPRQLIALESAGAGETALKTLSATRTNLPTTYRPLVQGEIRHGLRVTHLLDVQLANPAATAWLTRSIPSRSSTTV